MTNNLIMQLKIEKSKYEKELYDLNIKITRLLNELASKSCPFYEDIEEIEAIFIKQISDELVEVHNKAKDVKNKLKQISKQLGE